MGKLIKPIKNLSPNVKSISTSHNNNNLHEKSVGNIVILLKTQHGCSNRGVKMLNDTNDVGGDSQRPSFIDQQKWTGLHI